MRPQLHSGRPWRKSCDTTGPDNGILNSCLERLPDVLHSSGQGVMNGEMKFGKDIKGVIWDVDGVLLDSMRIWKDLGARYLLKHGFEPEEGLGEILFSMSMEQGAAYLRQHYPLEKTSDEILDELADMLRDYYVREVRAKDGALELLAALEHAGVRMAAATSSPREHISAALERNGLLTYIGRIFTNSEVGSSKHSTDIYHASAGFLRLKRDEICVVEDSLYALKTAADAGYHTAGIYDENGERDQKGLEEMAEMYFRSLEEMMQLL